MIQNIAHVHYLKKWYKLDIWEEKMEKDLSSIPFSPQSQEVKSLQSNAPQDLDSNYMNKLGVDVIARLFQQTGT